MTLISVYNSDGCVGRCDAHCYDAKHPHCDCICGGVNHGAGLKKAQENTREYADKWIETYIEKNKIEDGKGEVNPQTYQLSLF